MEKIIYYLTLGKYTVSTMENNGGALDRLGGTYWERHRNLSETNDANIKKKSRQSNVCANFQ